ncbi:MAG: hypothetical protein HC893_15860 [Chloroflexaceae bacterium]|nr:hypothetical protein [Chloroflexaceae bacterium]
MLVATAGCGLFNNASRERQEQNAPLTRGVVFGEVVMAEGIGSNNAPVNVTDTFSASQDFIYVVAEANRIEPGTTMFARWSHEGQPFEDSAEIQADQFYEDTFVEFHLENLQDRMEEGEYTVQIFVNGNPAEEVQFRVE